MLAHSQDSFFARLLGDIDARKDASEARAVAQINQEKETMKHFRWALHNEIQPLFSPLRSEGRT
jgi:hypothetical protein